MYTFNTMPSNDVHISKFLSLVLRHKPETIGITLDENGWTDVNTLIEKINVHGMGLDRTLLQLFVDTNPKKRFAFNDTGNKIRASQGHSVHVELGYVPKEPPAILYHGTTEKALPAILQTGLEKRSRQHVHLSADKETAIKVGQRHGKVVVLEVLAGEMFAGNFVFFLSDNGVWLTDFVPVAFLKIN